MLVAAVAVWCGAPVAQPVSDPEGRPGRSPSEKTKAREEKKRPATNIACLSCGLIYVGCPSPSENKGVLMEKVMESQLQSIPIKSSKDQRIQFAPRCAGFHAA